MNRVFFRPPGFTLTEVLVAIFILQLVIMPIYLVFTESRHLMISTKDLAQAVGMANSLMARLKQIDPAGLSEMAAQTDTDLTGPLALSALGLPPVPKGYRRTLALHPVDAAGLDGGPYWSAEVEVSWERSGKHAGQSFLLRDLVRKAKP